MVDKCRRDDCNNTVEHLRGGTIFCSTRCKNIDYNTGRREERARIRNEKMEVNPTFLKRGKIHYEGYVTL